MSRQPLYCDICDKTKSDVDWRRDRLSGLRMLLCISCDLARVLLAVSRNKT